MLERAALAAVSAWSLPWIPLWDLNFLRRVGRAFWHEQDQSLMAKRRGRWICYSSDAGSFIVLSIRYRLMSLSVKMV